MRAGIRLILALCLGFAAVVARAGPGEAIARVRPAEASGDAWISARVGAALVMDEALAASDIRVATKDGRVTLSGAVPSDEDARAAEQIAWRIEGVRAVDNALSVRPASSAPSP